MHDEKMGRQRSPKKHATCRRGGPAGVKRVQRD
jgi:hypothetical protein